MGSVCNREKEAGIHLDHRLHCRHKNLACLESHRLAELRNLADIERILAGIEVALGSWVERKEDSMACWDLGRWLARRSQPS